jgi:hypothetical protein
VLFTNACDDLAALVAAICALDELRLASPGANPVPDVRVLLTRAEEIGFIGAIGASRDGFMPVDAASSRSKPAAASRRTAPSAAGPSSAWATASASSARA